MGIRLLVVLLAFASLGLAAQAAPTTTLAPPSAIPSPAAQRLQPGDLISISVFDTPELATEARLDESGAIRMAEVGRIQLGGDTVAQAELAIAAELSVSYLRAPQVQLVVREFAIEPVTVLGAVRQPGLYSARVYPDLASMLAAAGGLAAPAGGEVLLQRLGQAKPGSWSIAQFERGDAAPRVALATGDIVRVTPPATVYVGGDVVKPGAYPLPASGLTLVEAISLAGGIERDGRSSQARIVHTDLDGRVSAQWLDARPILAGRAPDIALRPFDLVYVPHSLTEATWRRGMETALGVGTTILTGVVIFH